MTRFRKSLLVTVGAVLLFVSASQPARAGLIHDYEFKQNFHDSLGGPDLVPQGGTLDPVKGYSFGAGQGLSLSSALTNNGDYTISVHFRFDSATGWRKIIDPHNITPDIGLYVSPNSRINYFPDTVDGPDPFVAGVLNTVELTRDGGTGQVTASLNGVAQVSYNDTVRNDAVFNGPNNIIWFFVDDAGTGGTEVSAGFVDQILIFGPEAQVIPEPSSITLACLGGLGLLAFARRRLKKAAA